MKAARALLALGTLYVLLGCPHTLALDPSLDITQYAHTAWTSRNGFSQGAVYAIAQTPDGYLWLGTQSGVFRFDGVRAVPLALRPGQQLPSTAAGAVLPARDGTLWIGTLNGLASWKNGQLTEYPEFARRTVITLLQDRNGTVWAGGFGGPTGRLCAIRSGSTKCYGDDRKLGAVVGSLYEDSDGSLWVGAATGLWRWSPGPPTLYVPTPIPGRQTLAQGDGGSGLVAAVDRVRQIVGTRVTDYPLAGVPSPLTATSVLRDRNGGLWIGTTAHGLVHSYAGKTTVFTHKDGLSSDLVHALFEDREGTIWVTTSAGLDQFRELPVTSLSEQEGLSGTIIKSVLAARNGSIWIGTADGLNRWDHGRMTIYRRRSNPGLPNDDIHSLFQDEGGRIWVSSFNGLTVFDDGKFTAVPAVPAGDKHAIASDNHGGLWLSLWNTANDYGLAHLINGKITEHVSWQKLGGGPGTGLAPEPDGGIWTGMLSGGMAYFRAGQIQNLPLSEEQAGPRKVLDLWRDRDGAIWAATENGVSRIKNGRTATLTMANGLPCKTVHWIIEDDLSSYWLYTHCGLLRVARTDMDAWIADPTRTIRPTIFEDGIQLVPILKGNRPAVTKSPDGKIWFVNGDTLSFIDPSHIAVNTLPPPVHIEQIIADDKSYQATNGMRLPPHVHNLAISYTALTMVAPEKVRFRFKLEGQDKDWREVVNVRRLEYTNLAPGNYRFRVMACNNSGVWNGEGQVLEFSIAPAYYQTNWFRALCAAALIGLLWGLYQLRIRQLRNEERKFREAVETMPALAFIARPDGHRTFVNKRWVEYTGMTAEQAAGSDWQAAVYPDDLKRVLDNWRTSLVTGGPLQYELRLRRKADGEYRWFQTWVEPLRDQHGKLVKWCGVATDIEDRKRAEQQNARSYAQLKESEARYRRINRELRAISDCNQTLLHASDEQSLINEICRIVCEEAGYRMAWVGYAGRDAAKVVRPVAWAGIEESYLRAADISWSEETERGRNPTGTAIRSGTTCCNQDFTSDAGNATWHESALERGYRSSIALPLKDEHGSAFGALTIYSSEPNAFTAEEIRLLEELAGDLSYGIVTLRTRAERRRAEQDVALLRFAMDNVREAVFLVGEDARFHYANEEACRALACTRDEIIGRFVEEIDPDLSGEKFGLGWSYLKAQRSLSVEKQVRGKDGRTIPVEINSSYFEYDGHAYNLALARDITERKRAEEEKAKLQQHLHQAQKMGAIGQLAGGVAHDFNNILAIINGYSEILLNDQNLRQSHRAPIEQILAAGLRAASLTRQLLAFSRKLLLQPRLLNLNSVIEGLEKMLRRLIGDEIEVRTVLGPNLSAVIADPNQMEQVLLNFCINARDAMPKGGRITIETANVEVNEATAAQHLLLIKAGRLICPLCGEEVQPGPYVTVSVRDTGIGMDQETMSHIFEPFFTTKGPERGTGLGLATVYGIVQESGGHVLVDSEPGQGATFRVYLPAIRRVIGEREQISKPQELLRGTETVLLVEDVAPLRGLYRKILEDKGYTVLEADDGERAIQAAEQYQGKLALLLTDVSLPKLSGPALATILSQQRPTMKVLFMSGHTDDVISGPGNLVPPGASLLQKPFGAEELFRKMREILDRRAVPATRLQND